LKHGVTGFFNLSRFHYTPNISAAMRARSEESFSDLFERLADTLDPLETLKRLSGRVEFRDKETMLEELSAARAERRP